MMEICYYPGCTLKSKAIELDECARKVALKLGVEMKEMEKVEKQIQASIRSETGIRVDVTICEPESLPRSEGKAVRVIDERDFER